MLQFLPQMPRFRGWAPVLALPSAVLLLTPPEWPRWTLMWLLCFALFFGCKWLTWRRSGVGKAPRLRPLAYFFCWPGMDAAAFLGCDQGQRIDKACPPEWIAASVKLTAGIALFWGACRLIPPGEPLLLGWLGITAIALSLHFGAFQLMSCAWRTAGVNARPLMNKPLAATSVSDFWGKKWNTAFRDLTFRFVFRPLTTWLGPRWGVAAGFLFSGLVHELVISVPAKAGYGGPTAFFVIQAAALLIERSAWGRSIRLGRGWRGWVFTMLVLAAPALALFHPPFLRNVVVPFMAAMGAA